MSGEKSKADFYNEIYKDENYFGHQRWLYEPYVSSLVAYCGLEKGASVLDVGCGQGLFSFLFHRHGMKVHGVDISEIGIRAAEKHYGRLGITFSVADVQIATFPDPFDCIFVRSCSLYNSEDFASDNHVTRSLVRHLKEGGTFIFVYNSNHSPKINPTWRYHTLEEVKKHFRPYRHAQFFFVSKVSTFLLRRFTFGVWVTRFNLMLSKMTGRGGELVCVIHNQ